MASLFRAGIWFCKGMREFTNSGYEQASVNFESLDDTKLGGRSVMITGANSGLGKCTALALAKYGATVHMVCRDEKRGREALEELRVSSSNNNIFLHLVDMADPSAVHRFTQEFVKSGQPLHVLGPRPQQCKENTLSSSARGETVCSSAWERTPQIFFSFGKENSPHTGSGEEDTPCCKFSVPLIIMLVNNAGAMINERKLTPDGLEMNFAVNTLGTYIMTTGLVDYMSTFEKPKVITVSSGGMLTIKLDPNDLNSVHGFNGTMAYAQNKRQQVVLTDHWSSVYPRVYFSSMHPGWSDTPGVQTAMPSFRNRLSGKLRTSEQGADTIIWLAASDQCTDLPNGSFFQDRRAVPKHMKWAGTQSSPEDVTKFVQKVEELAAKFRS